MSGLDLGKQVGPLPLGAWIAAVGGGLGIMVYTRRQSATAAPTVVDDTSTDPGVGLGGTSGYTSTGALPTTDPGSGTTGYSDNDSWGKAAIDRLIADNYNPALVYSAISKALAGGTGDNKLSVQEYAIWNRALVALKSPPTPLNLPSPPSTTTTPTTVSRMQWVSTNVQANQNGQNIGQIQQSYASQAAAAGVWRPSGASLASVKAQAAIRSRVAPTTRLRSGTWIAVYKAVQQG